MRWSPCDSRCVSKVSMNTYEGRMGDGKKDQTLRHQIFDKCLFPKLIQEYTPRKKTPLQVYLMESETLIFCK